MIEQRPASVKDTQFAVPVAIAGQAIVFGPNTQGPFSVRMEPTAGLMCPRGILSWSQEVTVVQRKQLTESLLKSCNLQLPEHAIDPKHFPLAHAAAKRATLVAINEQAKQCLTDAGVCVYSIGFDQTSGFLFVLSTDGINLQGDVYQALGPSIETGDSPQQLQACLDGFVDRVLTHISGGVLSELAVEFAAALPEVSVKKAQNPTNEKTNLKERSDSIVSDLSPGIAQLDEIETFLAHHKKKYDSNSIAYSQLLRALKQAQQTRQSSVSLPLFSNASTYTQPALKLQWPAHDADDSFMLLQERTSWTVSDPVPLSKQVAQPVSALSKKNAFHASKQPSVALSQSFFTKPQPPPRRSPATTANIPLQDPNIMKEKSRASSPSSTPFPRSVSKTPVTAQALRIPVDTEALTPVDSNTEPPLRNELLSETKPIEQANASTSTEPTTGPEADASSKQLQSHDISVKIQDQQKPDSQPSHPTSPHKLFQLPISATTDSADANTADNITAAPNAADSTDASTADHDASDKFSTDRNELESQKQQADCTIDSAAKTTDNLTAEPSAPESGKDLEIALIPPVSQNKKSMIFGVVITVILLTLFVIWALR